MTKWSFFGGHIALQQMAEQTQFSLPARQAGTATKGRLHTSLGKASLFLPHRTTLSLPCGLYLALHAYELESRVL